MTRIALTIAGSDSGGGAGIQADLKTFSALGVYGASVVTAVTAQNTHGVARVETLSPAIVGAQIDAVLGDLAVDAVKIGMVSRSDVIRRIAERLRAHGRRAVLDPVMVAASGDPLLEAEALDALRTELLPLALVATPNLPEAGMLLGEAQADGEAAMRDQAERIRRLGAEAVLVKGGHGGGALSVDILVTGEEAFRFAAPRIETRNDHGTGCTLSAAIAAHLAGGLALDAAVEAAKTYLQGALAAGAALRIGGGRGPVHHFHRWWPRDAAPHAAEDGR